MLKKKFLPVGAVILALLFTSCGEKSPESATLKSLPASKAKTFITSEDDIADLIEELEEFDFYDDEGLEALEDAFEEFEDNTPAIFQEIADEIEETVEYFGDVIDGYDKTFNRTGKASYSFDKTIGEIKSLPEGLTVKIPSSKINFALEANRHGKADVDTAVDFSIDMNFNPAKIMGESYQNTILKGMNANASLKGTVKGDIYSDEDDFEYFFDDLEGVDLNCDVSANVLYAISFCSPEGIGGKAVITVQANYKGEFSEDTVEMLEDFFDELYYDSVRRKDFEALPFAVTASVKFYDDKGKETFAYMDNASLYDIYKLLSKIL